MEALRDTCGRLNRTLTHQLSPADRMKKRTMLGQIDLAASGLLERTMGTTRIYGRLVERDGDVVFAADGGHTHPVADHVLSPRTAEASYRL